jgi:hypothetical protein
MARLSKKRNVLVPAKLSVVESEEIRCDKCGRIIDPDDPPNDDEDLYAQVLEIYLNIDQCVNDRVKMDLCRACLTPIWAKICEAIGADPEDELRIGQDD